MFSNIFLFKGWIFITEIKLIFITIQHVLNTWRGLVFCIGRSIIDFILDGCFCSQFSLFSFQNDILPFDLDCSTCFWIFLPIILFLIIFITRFICLILIRYFCLRNKKSNRITICYIIWIFYIIFFYFLSFPWCSFKIRWCLQRLFQCLCSDRTSNRYILCHDGNICYLRTRKHTYST